MGIWEVAEKYLFYSERFFVALNVQTDTIAE